MRSDSSPEVVRAALLVAVCLVLAGCTAAGTPGVGDERVTDVDALTAAHETARGDRYVLVVNETTHTRLGSGAEPTVLRDETRYRVDGDRAFVVRTQWRGHGASDPELVTRGETYATGGERLVRYSREGATRYAALSPGLPPDPLVDGELLVLDRARVTGNVGGAEGAVLLRRADDPLGHGEYGSETVAEAVLHPHGFVSSVRVEQTSVTPERRTVLVATYRYVDRDATVERPGWYEAALEATEGPNRIG